MKALDTSAAAQQHLYKSLFKIKAVSGHPDLPAELKAPLKVQADPAFLNINARLCKSNSVSDVLKVALAEIRNALGIQNQDPAASTKKKRLRAKDFEPSTSGQAPRRQDGPNANDTLSRVDDADSPSADDRLAGISLDEFEELDERLAPLSDDDEVPGSDVEELEQRLAAEGVRTKAEDGHVVDYDLEADLSIASSESEARSLSPEPQKAPPSKKSSFLPSLTMGGYISGSGSDIDDVDIAPKKNRRGQRARQQIWEQKYGSTAKHLQKEDRDRGWDPKRGATDGSRHRRTGARRDVHGDLKDHNERRQHQQKATHQDDKGPIHPSWEAAKRAKEKREAPVAFQGKKITFD